MVAGIAFARGASRLARLCEAKACWVKSGPVVEGRGALRVPFGEPIVITPWEPGNGPAGPSLLASGHDVSAAGVAFWHSDPLPYRFVAVSLRGDGEDEDGHPSVETVLVELLWCRFLRRGTYLSGGRMERILGAEFGRPLAILLGAPDIRLRQTSHR